MKAVAALCMMLAVASAMELEFRPMDLLEDQAVGLEERFTAFKQMFAKTYETAEKEAYAAKAFAWNDEYIHKHNAGNSTFTVGHNEFSDLMWDEFKALYVSGLESNPHLRRQKNVDLSLLSAPFADSVDWVAKGAVTPVKNQGQCGSCWAFSTTGSTEGAYQIATGTLLSLSEQNLVDCGRKYGNQGCNGGLMDDGFKEIKAAGIALESAYPYTAKTGTCKSISPAVTVTGYSDVPTKNQNALKAAVTKQPVSVAIEADKQAFQLYKGGVFTSATCGTKLDHGVLVVGYGNSQGMDYWKVKNSWGPSWGDKGYIMIEQGKNLCGITQQPSYPTGAKKAAPGPAPGPTPPPSPTPPGPAGKSHYEDPNDGGCMPDEQAVQIQGVQGSICTPECTGIFKTKCPTDVPAGVTAAPQCALKTTTGGKYCALICSPSEDEEALRAGDGQCGKKASCKSAGVGVGICTYDS